jgi:peptide/nickel transport system permease protein
MASESTTYSARSVADAARARSAVPKQRRVFSWRNIRREPRFLIGGTLIGLLILAASFAPLVISQDPMISHPADANQPPSAVHVLGTDDLGRDVLGRTVYGARVSLSVGVIAVGIGLGLGVALGLAAGYRGRWADLLISRVIDALLAFPALLLAISITAALGPSLSNTMIAIGVVAVPIYARLTRGQVLQIKEREYVEAARTIGATEWRIATRHILVNVVNPLIIQASLSIAFAILAEASLSFLGLGAQPPTPSWGADLNHARDYLSNGFWWMSIGPGVAILLTVFSFNLLGDSIRDLLDPRLRNR